MKTIKTNSATRIGAIALLFLSLIVSTAVQAQSPLPGAIFTTDSTCSGVDLNIYGSKSDVYINGGPAHPGAASLPDGSYCVQVTAPDGTVLGVSAPGAVTVSGGAFAQCYQLTSILNTASSSFTVAGYDDTDNPGGEYKVWVSTDCTFTNNSTKTDNFKVKAGGGGPGETATLCVTKFYDTNANGTQDPGEPDITGWLFNVFAADNLQLTRETPRCVVLDPGTFTVTEGTPIELDWVHTTSTSVPVTLAADDNKSVSFGNVCLGPGGGLTLGFWSNKNGQSLETLADFAFLNTLNIVQANGNLERFSSALNTAKTQLNSWLLNATATNMAYMLSAQLATMELNVRHPTNKYNNNTGVSGNALVYAPNLLQSINPSFPATAGLNARGFITINDLMAAANNTLVAPGNLTVGASTLRSYEQVLKTALDDANNNLNFTQSSPCTFSFGD